MPPKPRTIKAWERAPIPAHAPRLQGQKIWKKAGLRLQREHDREDFDAAQKELEQEGKGARKRMRVHGAKENIGNPTWKEDAKSITDENILDKSVAKIETGTSIPLNDADANALQFVPRKRTNANHVITPRKHLRQRTLNAQAQMQAFTKSPQPSPEKPAKWRKSMRKSIRKSIAGGISEVPMAPVEGKFTPGKSATEVVQPVVIVEDESNQSLAQHQQPWSKEEAEKGNELICSPIEASVKEPNAESSLNDKLNKLFDFTDDEQHTTQEPEHTLDDTAGQSLSSSLSNQPIKVPLNHMEGPQENTSRPAQIEVEEPINVDGEESSRRGPQPVEAPCAILESIETNASADAIRPVKATNAPNKKRGTSQRGGTRRSTRTTRSSSVRAEEQAAPEAGDEPAVKQSLSPLEINPGAPENIKEVVTAFESEPAIEEEPSPESEPIPDNEPVIEAKSVQSTDIKESEASTEPGEAELESFDIPGPAVSEALVVVTNQTMANEDFELPPAPVSIHSASSNASHNETKVEDAGRSEAGLAPLSDESTRDDSWPVRFSSASDKSNTEASKNSEEFMVEALETLEPVSISADSKDFVNEIDTMSSPSEDLTERSNPDLTNSELAVAVSENPPATVYDHDDTDMLRNFLTRVKANKAAKAGTQIPKRKRSLPHSPLRLPLGEADAAVSPSPPKTQDEFGVGLPGPSPGKRQKRSDPILVDEDDTITERKPTRRSGRTRLPVIKTPLGAPSHIPVRRLGQDGDTTVTLKRSEEKELAALTRVNTRKNKGGSHSVPETLAKKAEEKEDPVLRQRLLREVFDERTQKDKKEKKVKTVVWAEELTQYQTVEGRKLDCDKEKEKETQKVAPPEEKKSAVMVGIRSKIALGMAANGTPAPKRKRGHK